ncbi:MAG: peptidylprolyl isomerase [Myxococcota bacterium]
MAACSTTDPTKTTANPPQAATAESFQTPNLAQQAHEEHRNRGAERDENRRAQPVARVDEVDITLGEFEDELNAQAPMLRRGFMSEESLRRLLDNRIRLELLAAEAVRQRYDRTPRVIQSTKQNSVEHLIQSQFDQQWTPASLPPEDIRSYYDTHRQEFTRPELVRASHILLATSEEAESTLNEVRELDLRGFRSRARERSIDQETRLRGGDLRYFSRDGRPPKSEDAPVDSAIVEAAFALSTVGEVSQVIPVGNHFSIVKLTGRRSGEVESFEQAETSIRSRLWRIKRQGAIDDLVSELRAKDPVKTRYEMLAEIKLLPELPLPGLTRSHQNDGPSD